MSRAAVASPEAPQALGPYSQAQLLQSGASRVVYTSGQIGIDPKSGSVAEGVGAQTKQVIANLEAVLAAAGMTLADVVKTTVFLVDMGDFAAMNAIYAGEFGETRPARSTIAVAALPVGARVEIEAWAYVPEGR